MTMEILVKTLEGLEPVLDKEIRDMGIDETTVLNRAVMFEGDIVDLYRANYKLRTALRVLLPIHKFEAINEHMFYRKMQEINWAEYFNVNQRFAVYSVVTSQYFTHSKYIALKAKDAIVDQFREKYGKRPDVSTYSPDVEINIHIYENKCTISLDSSGESLHKREYKVSTVEAPLSEVLAAGILLNTGFEQFRSFHDPMCGSGTFISEALMIHCQIPPGKFKQDFAFKKWKNFRQSVWDDVREKADALIRPPEIEFYGSDIDRQNMFAARKNLTQLPYGDTVHFVKKDFLKDKIVPKPAFLIMNPPYDVRLQVEDIAEFYYQIGVTLREHYKGTRVCVFSGNLDLMHKIGLKADTKLNLMNGAIPSVLQCYTVNPD
jgi:putative N6-adenine-specific DNA methylase